MISAMSMILQYGFSGVNNTPHFKENIKENYFMCKYPHCGEIVFPKTTFSRPLPMKMGPLSKKKVGEF
jgi:hypothetical protein